MSESLAGDKIASLDEISQEIDLKEYLGDKPSAEQKKVFAELAKETMESRTLDGDDINGITFAKYSKDYADAKGVTRDSVDLFVDGKMLDGIGRRSSKEKTNTIFMQMKKGIETRKAYNHDTGDTLPQREFFGITKAEAINIAEVVKSRGPDPKKRTIGDLKAALSILDIEQS